ncbi:MAG: 23S rRNA (uracil(1939)-C(5))-methyltransferase RlmD [Desulfosarcinaceae bacterium]|nr:23S rRNA (uracil(1939)-C(5))-methyltransferase RlmD [Desulfosarcinaceae bacterium]
MKIKRGQALEITVSDIAFGGRGIVKIDGFTVFVDQAVPGDVVKARIFRKKRSYAEARAVEILTPSADRVAAPCPYSGYCGGCKWQFLRYAKQLEYKRRHVAESLEHIALLEGIPVHATLPSERVFGYRNKMEFSTSDRRWLLPEELGQEIDTSFALGLHVPGTFNKVLDIDACLLQPDLGNTLLGDIKDALKASGLPVYGLKSHEGFWRFVMLRHSVSRDEWMVNLITKTENPEALRPIAERLMARHPAVVSVVNNVTARKSGVAIGEYERPLAGANQIQDRIGAYTFNISANSFFQTNTRGAGRLYEQVMQFADLTGTETVVDLYCGTGTIAICLAGRAKEVVGFEIVESAVADAEANCRRNGIANCRFVLGDIRHRLAELAMTPDLLVIDPPRVGMHKDVVKQVLALAPPRIVYVSCNPATLARDLGIMKETYRVREVQPVDMFPHTFHIEAVALLERW